MAPVKIVTKAKGVSWSKTYLIMIQGPGFTISPVMEFLNYALYNLLSSIIPRKTKQPAKNA